MTKKKPHPAPKLVHGYTDDDFYYLPQPVPAGSVLFASGSHDPFGFREGDRRFMVPSLMSVLDEICHRLMGKCMCMDCYGSEPEHSPDCEYMLAFCHDSQQELEQAASPHQQL